MRIKYVRMAALAVVLMTSSMASARLLIAHNGNSLSLFADDGTLIRNYSTDLSNPKGVVTDNSSNVYVAEYGTPGLFNGNVKMYNIATGAFIRNILPSNLYSPTGVAFNPANPGEIIVMGQYSAGASQLGRWDTSTTGVCTGANSDLGVPYAGAYYSPVIAGVVPTAGVYVAATAGVIQQFNASTLAQITTSGTDIYTTSPSAITGTAANLFYTSSTGKVTRKSDGVAIVNNAGDSYLGITNDGTNLWVSQYNSGFAGRYSTSGVLNGYFAIVQPVVIAYVPCAEELAGDLNGDCTVDFKDFAIMAGEWLQCNREPQNDCLP